MDAQTESEHGQSFKLPWGESAEVDLQTPIAAVELRPLESGEVPHLEFIGSRNGAEVQIHEHGSVVRIEVKARNTFFQWGVRTQLRLCLPANAHARVALEAGAIRAQGFQGCQLQLTTQAGAVLLRDVQGQLTLRTSAGAIKGERVGGTLDVETGAGSVKLDVTSLEPGEHRVRSNLGAVKVRLDSGIVARVLTHTTLGSVRTRFRSQPDAAAVLKLDSELGAIKVEGSAGGADGPWREKADWPRGEDFKPWEQWSEWMGPWASAWAERAWAARPPFPPAPPQPPPAAAPAPSVGEEELRRILTMVEQGVVSASEAEKLIRAIERR